MKLVTGGTGLLGSHVLFSLAENNDTIRAIYRSDSSLDRVRRVFQCYSDSSEKLFSTIEWVRGEITDTGFIQETLSGISDVYHCAAMVSYIPRERNEMMNVNINGTANIVNSALKNGVKKLCHVSSIAALGRSGKGELITERTEWRKSKLNSAYGISKFEAEREVWRGIAEGLNTVIINPSVILGPMYWDRAAGKAFGKIYRGSGYYTEGINGFVEVNDLVQCALLLMRKEVFGRRFIINSENMSYRLLFELIAASFNKPLPKKPLTKGIAGLLWRAEMIKYKLTGMEPLITKEIAHTIQNHYRYDNTDISEAIGYKFKPMKDAINAICKLYLNEYS